MGKEVGAMKSSKALKKTKPSNKHGEDPPIHSCGVRLWLQAQTVRYQQDALWCVPPHRGSLKPQILNNRISQS